MYKIIFDKEADKFLEKSDEFIRKRIIKKIIELIPDPFQHIKRLKNRNDFSLRVGDYRVLMEITDNNIKILKIGHRKNIYDK